MLALIIPPFIVLLAILIYRRRSNSLPYPPGPAPRWLIGNVLDIPIKFPWLVYMRWSKQYNSDILYYSTLNLKMVVLNKHADAVELFEKRAAIYSDRCVLPMLRTVGIDKATGNLPYGKEWQNHRKLLQETLKKDRILLFHDVITEKVHLLLEQLVRDPLHFDKHCKTLVTSVVMASAFGYDVIPERKDPFLDIVEWSVEHAFSFMLPGRTLINVFPFLRNIPTWLPGASTQRFAAKIGEGMARYQNEPFDFVKKNMAAGTAKGSMTADLLEQYGSNYDESTIRDVMGTVYIATLETTRSTLLNFILAMTVHPEAQKKAQEEIDKIVGLGRLPTFEDRNSLLYVEALYREVLRWKVAVPVGVPHLALADDVYKGYYIPKGTLVLGNAWAMSRDEVKYGPNSESFHPERYFDKDGILDDTDLTYTFGFGRRICPGRHMAEAVVWLMITCTLAAFSISKARDENGMEIHVNADAMTNSLVSHPMPFECCIRPRSKEVEALIHSEAGIARQSLDPSRSILL